MQIGFTDVLVMITFFAIQTSIIGTLAYCDVRGLKAELEEGWVSDVNFIKTLWYLGLLVFAIASSVAVPLLIALSR